MKNKKRLCLLLAFLLICLQTDLLLADSSCGIKYEKAETISLEQISKSAIENSLDMQIAKYDAYIKRTHLGKAKSIFDTFLYGRTNTTSDEKTKTSVLYGDKTILNTYNAGFQKKLFTGTTIGLDALHTRTDTDSPFNTFNPTHEATAGISISQPLGKNIFGLSDRAQVEITKLDIENSEFTSLDNMEQILANIQIAYWNFALKNEELRIKKDILRKAERLNQIYKEKHKSGLAENVDALAVEANLTVRESDVLMAKLQLDTAKINLLFLLNEEDITKKIRPVDQLDITPQLVSLTPSIKRAIEFRRDYKKVKNSLDLMNINLSVKKNALWPEIDLTASFERNGIDVSGDDAWDNLKDEENREYTVGVAFKFPLENSYARAEYKETKMQKKQLILVLKKTERKILSDINNSVNKVNTLRYQVDLSSTLVSLQENKFNEESKRLKFGRSNSDLIIRYENDLLEALLNYARNIFEYRKSVIELDLAQNTLLDKYWEDEL